MMSFSNYLIRKILPNFKSGHTRYVECVKDYFRDGCRWLDAGGGKRVFPDLYDGERELIARARHAVVCDADAASLADHVSIDNRVCCSLSELPLESNSFDLITCGMVVEHLYEPQKCIRELSRVLDAKGLLIIHTVNYIGYPTLIAELSKLLPYRKWMISKVTGRREDDIFPTRYRCNTGPTLRRYLREAGLHVAEVRYQDAGLLFPRLWPLALLECIYIRLTRLPALARFRGQLIAIATKP
jgi:SAM-dependent methyltransferase